MQQKNRKTKKEKAAAPLVVFDIGNVLLRFSLEKARNNFDRTHPGSGDPLVRCLWRSQLGRDFEKGRWGGPGFFRELVRVTKTRMSYRIFCRAFCDIFTPLSENLNLLSRVARRYPTALLSNTNAIHWAHLLRTYPELRQAKFALASHRLRAMKPGRSIYRELTRRTGFPPRKIVYVDDHPEFVAAARRLGIRAHCFDGTSSLKALLAREGIDAVGIKNRGLIQR